MPLDSNHRGQAEPILFTFAKLWEIKLDLGSFTDGHDRYVQAFETYPLGMTWCLSSGRQNPRETENSENCSEDRKWLSRDLETCHQWGKWRWGGGGLRPNKEAWPSAKPCSACHTSKEGVLHFLYCISQSQASKLYCAVLIRVYQKKKRAPKAQSCCDQTYSHKSQ